LALVSVAEEAELAMNYLAAVRETVTLYYFQTVDATDPILLVYPSILASVSQDLTIPDDSR
jgi:hypothetical protein